MVRVDECIGFVILFLLVGIDEHETLVGKVLCYLLGQVGKGILVGDAALA